MRRRRDDSEEGHQSSQENGERLVGLTNIGAVWGLFENLPEGLIATQTITKTLKPVRDRISNAAAQLKGILGTRWSSCSITRTIACR